MFLVVKGRLRMRFRDREVALEPEESSSFRGAWACPVAEETHILLLEPKTTLNTGNVSNYGETGTYMKRRLYQLDVFTTKPFAGNPLAVVTDGDGLSVARMQAIARDESFRDCFYPAADEQPRARAAAHLHDHRRLRWRGTHGTWFLMG